MSEAQIPAVDFFELDGGRHGHPRCHESGTTGSRPGRSDLAKHDAGGALTVLGGVGHLGAASRADRGARAARGQSRGSAHARAGGAGGRRAGLRGPRGRAIAGPGGPLTLTLSPPGGERGSETGAAPPSPVVARRRRQRRQSRADEGSGGGAAGQSVVRRAARRHQGALRGPPPPEGTLRARPGRPSVDEMRVEMERQQDAVANVDAGRVNPLLYEYLRGARSRFKQDAERLADDLAVGAGDAARGWGRGYLNTRPRREPRRDRRANGPAARGAAATHATRRLAAPTCWASTARPTGKRRPAPRSGARRFAWMSPPAARRRRLSVAAPATPRSIADRGVVHEGDRGAPRSVRRAPRPRLLRAPHLGVSYAAAAVHQLQLRHRRHGPTCVWPYKKVTSVKGRLLSVDYPPADGSAPQHPSLLRQAALIEGAHGGRRRRNSYSASQAAARCAENSKACY